MGKINVLSFAVAFLDEFQIAPRFAQVQMGRPAEVAGDLLCGHIFVDVVKISVVKRAEGQTLGLESGKRRKQVPVKQIVHEKLLWGFFRLLYYITL